VKPQRSLEAEQLKLERQRLAIETRLKRSDQQFQRQQFESSRRGIAAWAQVVTPVGAAVIAGIIGLFGTVWNGYQGNRIETAKHAAEERLEKQKLESNLILEAIKTGGQGEEKERQIAANLVFLVDAGLLQLPADKLANLRKLAGDTLPSLPQPVSGLGNFSELVTPRQRESNNIESIVIHSTETARNTNMKALEEMLRRRALAHYLIAPNGDVIQILNESQVALHVGPASAPKFGNGSF
jgi:N-acetylmuramoyl-L-alanine amidase